MLNGLDIAQAQRAEEGGTDPFAGNSEWEDVPGDFDLADALAAITPEGDAPASVDASGGVFVVSRYVRKDLRDSSSSHVASPLGHVSMRALAQSKYKARSARGGSLCHSSLTRFSRGSTVRGCPVGPSTQPANLLAPIPPPTLQPLTGSLWPLSTIRVRPRRSIYDVLTLFL